jgi:hypothetical protein
VGVAAILDGNPMKTVVKIADLVDSRSRIEDRKFEDAEILGPAVLAPLEGVHFLNSMFEGTFESVFREVPEGQMLLGVVGLQRVIFDRCKFTNIGIVGPHDFIVLASKGFGPGPVS